MRTQPCNRVAVQKRKHAPGWWLCDRVLNRCGPPFFGPAGLVHRDMLLDMWSARATCLGCKSFLGRPASAHTPVHMSMHIHARVFFGPVFHPMLQLSARLQEQEKKWRCPPKSKQWRLIRRMHARALTRMQTDTQVRTHTHARTHAYVCVCARASHAHTYKANKWSVVGLVLMLPSYAEKK